MPICYRKEDYFLCSCCAFSLLAPAKLGSWFLLLIISYTLVSLINRPKAMSSQEEETAVVHPTEQEAA